MVPVKETFSIIPVMNCVKDTSDSSWMLSRARGELLEYSVTCRKSSPFIMTLAISIIALSCCELSAMHLAFLHHGEHNKAGCKAVVFSLSVSCVFSTVCAVMFSQVLIELQL